MKLKNSRVFRGGVTATYPQLESENVELYCSRSLNFKFSLASAGGGTTKVRLEIGPDDISKIIGLYATMNPEFAGRFAECAAFASGELLKSLDKLQKASNDGKST